MKRVILTILVVLLAWTQFIFPAQIAPFSLVPDMALLVAFALALYYEPAEQAIWLALVAGLALDLWQPTHFGVWSLACMLVVIVTRLVHTRLLPRANWLSILATATVALGVGELTVLLREYLFSGAGLAVAGTAALRIYLPRLLLDLLLLFPLAALIRSFLRALRVSGDNRIMLDHATGRLPH
ncbi:MAG: rod shape-determining protein MreD [Candidatus Andersenbacteria bacterium]